MTQITLNIPDAVLPRVINGISRQYEYRDTLPDGTPNPETRAQFARRQVILWVKRTVRQAEVEAAREAAEIEAGETADEEVVIT